MMAHKYWEEDSEQRHSYFEGQFFANAQDVANKQGIPVNAILGKVTSFKGFKEAVKIAWSKDGSLIAYFEGMSEDSKRDFYNRLKIQNLLIEKIPREIPEKIIQVEKKTRKLFKGSVKGRRTLIKKDYVNIKGKRRQIYRDSRGRFASRI